MNLLILLMALTYQEDVTALGSDFYEVRVAARMRLDKQGILAIPALMVGSRDPDLERRRACERLLERYRPADKEGGW